MEAIELIALAERLSANSGIAAKEDIGIVADRLGLADQDIAVGDDCAALPDGEGYLLFAMEGFINEFVAADPWFAGWCGVMVNISDIAAMGGRPIAVADAVWTKGAESAEPILEGMKAASSAFGVPIVGGHTNIKTQQSQLSVAILGRARRLLTSFDAKAGDILVAAIDHRGRYREPFSNWEAATDAPPTRLRGDIELLPMIAELELAAAAKDISQGGIVGTAIMLAECSGVGIDIVVGDIPVPRGVSLDRWLTTFPSFGYLISVPPRHLARVLELFSARDITAATIGHVNGSTEVALTGGGTRAVVRDYAAYPLLRLGKQEEEA